VEIKLPETIEECHSLIKNLLLIIEKQQAEIELLKAEVSELKERLNQNSGNSNRPPSSDGFNKPNPQPAFKKKKKNKGGQSGHRGKTLKRVAEPDVVVDCEPMSCQCGMAEWTAEVEIAETRQVFELPEPRLEVIEYRRIKRRCGCGRAASGKFPSEVVAPVQYGVRVQAMVSLLSISGCLSFGKIGQLFADLYGYELNTATCQTMVQRTSQAMPMEAIKNEILKAEVVNADETGIKENGVLKWLHTASTENLTYQYVHPKRGKEAMRDEKSILPIFRGILVHDCWESYFSFSQMRHAICNAHILRELTGLIENQQSVWGKKMKELLLEMYRASDYGKGVIEEIGNYQNRYQEILNLAEREEPPAEKINRKGKYKRSKGRNLLERLRKHEEAVMSFAVQAEVPFTNNQAERDIRQVKVKQRVSSGFRAESGTESFYRIHSFISTLRKQGRKVFEELQAIIEGKPFEVFQT
jgi:transposase